MRAVIIDDEPRARETIRQMITTYCKDIEIAGEGYDVQSGAERIKTLSPDVVFLDIRMPDGTGFDLLDRLDELNFSVVFLTAYDEYALKSFKYSAVDYLLKPVDPEDLIACEKKLKKTVNLRNMQLEVLVENLKQDRHSFQKLVLKTNDTVHIIKIADIIRAESDGNYTRFYVVDRSPILISKTLKEFDTMLCDINFFRIHQSHLINLHRIIQIDKQNGITAHMDDGSKVPVSFRKKDLLYSALSSL